MDRRARVFAVLDGKMPDQIPYHFDLTGPVCRRLGTLYRVLPGEVEEVIGNHLIYCSPLEAEDFQRKRIEERYEYDECGVLWDEKGSQTIGDPEMVAHPLKSFSLDGFSFPNAAQGNRMRGIAETCARSPDRFRTLNLIGLFDTAWRVTGLEQMLCAMALDEDFVKRLLDLALDYLCGLLEQTPSCVDGVRFVEDWGQQKGLMMGGERWRRLLRPRLAVMYACARKKGLRVLIHSCGDIAELFPDLIELGVECINDIQPECMDVVRLKNEYGKDVTLFGGVGSQSTIPIGSPADVEAEAALRLEQLGKDGRYILGPAGAIPGEAPVENVDTLVRFCQKNLGGYER